MEKIRTKYAKEIIMSLFKQMALAIAFIIIVLLGSVMSINYQSSKKDMIESLYQTSVNNISSLSSQLAQAENDPALIRSIIDAQYDSGYFKKIAYTTSDGAFHYIKEDTNAIEGVPQWFIAFTDIELQSVTTDVSAGWEILGKLQLQGDTGIVYKGLYKILMQLFYIFIVAVTLSLFILSILLKILLKPLKKAQKQAEAIAKNQFILQEDIPYTTEFRDVVLGMNSMVSKLKVIFDKANATLKEQKEKEYTDQVTQLKKQKYLRDKLPEFLKIDAHSKGGIFMLLGIQGVIEANEQLGHEKVDLLFKKFADILRENTKEFQEHIIARIEGTEFALFLPNCDLLTAKEQAHKILQAFSHFIKEYQLNENVTFLAVGLYEYNYQENIDTLLTKAKNALLEAKKREQKIHIAHADTLHELMDEATWYKVLTSAIQYYQFQFSPWKTLNAKNRQLVHYALSLTLKADKTYSYNQFMAPANQIGLSNDIYRVALNILLKTPDKALHNTVCSLRLPYEFLVQPTSYDEVQTLLNHYARKLPLKLIIEMPDKFMRQEKHLVQKYKKLLEKLHIELGIFEFIGESHDYQYLQQLRPLYIKADVGYYLSQSLQSLSALKLVSDSIGIELIASGVIDIESLKKLQNREIYTIQGKITESLDSSGV